MEEEDGPLDLIDVKAAEEGKWYPFQGQAKFLIKRIGALRRRKLFRQWFKTTTQNLDFEKSIAFQIALGCEALVNSQKVRIHARYLDGTPLAGEQGDVLLDGRWSPEVKKAVLSEVAGLLKFVVAKADSQDAEADEDEEGKE